MITKDNFKYLLKTLDFEENEGVFIKYFENNDTGLSVDFNKKSLIYPESDGLIINERQTCNFSSNENFVVFECVHRLLDKGYKPNHIELEPKWQIGHGASGGRADVLIKNNYGKALLIIECKTDGREFQEAWKRMQTQPTQLFSYAQQIRSTEFICLYSSDYDNGVVTYSNFIITLRDNDKLLEELVDQDPLSYKKAQETEDIFNVWKNTYKQDVATKGIFEEEIQPYNIGKIKFSLKDLKMVSSKDIQGKYHDFATILRQHNVSGRENAFDKLVNLFLCKIVDENEHSNDLQFYWKGIAYDNYFDLIDRLQKLYKIGMDKFLEEEVTYVDEKSIDEAFRYFKNDKDATRDTIKNYFRQLKFFTNSDFAFIDVHNESLFYQNSEVLLKMVKLLQDIRLKTDEQNQFLGDMFEGFLDQGVKQSEGQFFTPMPIVKFILSALPLEDIIAKSEIPKVIDYACGAGHFLNEYALQIKPIVERIKKVPIDDYYPEVVGIEKEYRLSKVAKVSAFMYGQDDINIIYTDALAESPHIKDGTFSLLIANPPYSVKGFLETLSPAERKKFDLLQAIDSKTFSNNNSIETFFIERAKQLLKPGGLAAIIVPSSIINKGSQKNTSKKQNVYVATRELLLKYFDLVAFCEFGKGTFGKTGTNTVTLFLRRKEENPSLAEQYKIRVATWFNGDTSKDGLFEDDKYIKLYCSHIGINFEDYLTLLKGTPSMELKRTEMFLQYSTDFEKSSEVITKRKLQSFKSLKLDLQQKEIGSMFLIYLQKIEKEKLYYFVLASHNPQDVIVLKAPSDSASEKKFLGYEWSAAKGKEGIKYIGNAKIKIDTDVEEAEDDGIIILDDDDKRVLGNLLNLANIRTPLYDPQDRNNNNKINHLIHENFLKKEVIIPESLQSFVSKVRLVDMLDFTRKEFNKSLSLTPKRNIDILTKWSLDTIENIVETIESGSRPEGGVGGFTEGVLSLGGEHIHSSDGSVDLSSPKFVPLTFYNAANKGVLKENDILICKDGALTGKIALLRKELNGKEAMVNEHVFILRCSNLNTQMYVYNFLFSALGQEILKSNITGSAQGGLNSTNLKNIKIPLPNKNTRESIVKACQKIDGEIFKAHQTIKNASKEIEDKIQEVYSKGYKMKKLSDPEIAILNPSKREISDLTDSLKISFVDMSSVSEKGIIEKKEDRFLGDLRKGGYTYFRENDIIIAKITPCMENGKCAIANNLTNGLGLGSTEFHVIRVMGLLKNKFIFTFLNREAVRIEAEKNMTGSSGHRRVPISFYEKFLIPILNNKEQMSFLKEIEKLEEKISISQLLINEASQKKQSIIQEYL